jgi:cell division protein FtsW (lipid II flippase)
MLNPELDPQGAGYLELMVRRIFSSSQPFAAAILDGDLSQMSLEQFLPGWSTDFSLTYLIARFGYIAGFAIVTVMSILILRMFVSVMKQKNVYGFLLSFSACLAITVQAVFYVLSNIGIIIPFTVTLPFISFGGMGYIVNMMLLGLLLSVYRRTNLVKDRLQGVAGDKGRLQGVACDKRLFTYEDGKLIINFRIKPVENTKK